LSEITNAIKARQTQIVQLQSDIETLQRAASLMGGGETPPAKATRQPTVKPQARAAPKPKKPRSAWSVARGLG